MNTHHCLRSLKFAVLIVVAVYFGASLANAQELRVKISLPFEVHWGPAVLAPGNYSITLNSRVHYPEYTLISWEGNQKNTFVLSSSCEPNFFGGSGLIVERRGTRYTVRSLRFAEAGLVFNYPPAKAQRPVLAQEPVLFQRLPILMASK